MLGLLQDAVSKWECRETCKHTCLIAQTQGPDATEGYLSQWLEVKTGGIQEYVKKSADRESKICALLACDVEPKNS